MARKPKMPKYVGMQMRDGRIGPAVYAITMDIVPADFGISEDATNSEMVRGLSDHINAKITKAREAARAEGEAAGRAAERAAVVTYLRDHRDVAERRGGQQVDAGLNPAVRRWVLHEAIPDIMNGEHLAPAPGGTP